MKAYAQKPGQPRQDTSLHHNSPTQHTLANQAARALPHADTEIPQAARVASAPTNFAHDFSRIPVHTEVPSLIQSKPVTSPSSGATPGVRATGNNSAGLLPGGAPLDADVRARYEPRLGTSLADVRIHADARAAASADALDAEAYTVGRDIIFAAGRYQPRSHEGRRLLAHELAHFVQQRHSVAPVAGSALSVSHPGDPAEREADHAADALLAGHSAHLAPRSGAHAIQRQQKPQRRANRFLPGEKTQLRKMGRGELDELIEQVIADGKYHRVRQQTIDGVEHTWEVKTEIVELTEQEQVEGAKFGGALTPEKNTPSPDGKKMLHQFTYILRGGRASTMQSALHELIHLRISIDRTLPEADRSSFFSEYSQLNEMTEVMASAKFGAKGTIGQKSSYGALPIVSGNWENVKFVLERLEAIRSFYIGHDASAAAKFDSDQTVTPAALVEFVVQEKYVTQAASMAVSNNKPGNETVATRYARMAASRFSGLVSEAARTRITSSAIGSRQENDLIDRLRIAIQRLYDALDLSLRQAREFEKNPPPPPAVMPNPNMYAPRPLDLSGRPIPFE